jgi:F0F1-type ATP synthase assembly protein I
LIHPAEQSRRWRPATIVLAVVVAAVLLLGLIAGLALDDRLGTRPVATLVCALTAAHIAVIVVFRRVSTALREIAEAGRDKSDSGE